MGKRRLGWAQSGIKSLAEGLNGRCGMMATQLRQARCRSYGRCDDLGVADAAHPQSGWIKTGWRKPLGVGRRNPRTERFT